MTAGFVAVGADVLKRNLVTVDPHQTTRTSQSKPCKKKPASQRCLAAARPAGVVPSRSGTPKLDVGVPDLNSGGRGSFGFVVFRRLL